MSPALMLMTLPCTIRHITHGEQDVYGDKPSATATTQALCDLQQSRSTETRDGGQLVVTEWNLYGFRDPATGGLLEVPLAAGDEIEIDDVVYAVDGTPWRVRDPLPGTTSHVEARVRVARTERGTP